MMTAEEARKLANEKREGYLAGLLSHYLTDVQISISFASQTGRMYTTYIINHEHIKDISAKWSKHLRSLGYKVKKNKDHFEISWEKEKEVNG